MFRRVKIPLVVSALIVGGMLWLMLRSGAPVNHSGGVSIQKVERDLAAVPLPDPLQPGSPAVDESVPLPDGLPALPAAVEAALHGRVTAEADGRGLGGARIYVEVLGADRMDSWKQQGVFRQRALGSEAVPEDPIVARAVAGADGYYSIRLGSMQPGDYAVLARHDTHCALVETWTWVPESFELNFQLVPGDSISGVVRGPDGAPVSGAVVEALVEEGGGDWRSWMRAPELLDRTQTDRGGVFVLNVVPGTFRVEVSASGLARSVLNGVESGTTQLDIVLGPGRSIAGRVADENGRPLSGVSVSLTTHFGEGSSGVGSGWRPPPRVLRLLRTIDARIESDADGRFQFQDVSPSLYMVEAAVPGRVPARIDVEIGEDPEPQPLELTLLPGGVLEGVVRDTRGEPVEGALVLVSKDRGRKRSGRSRPVSLFRAVAATETDEDGAYVFDTLPEEDYSLSVQADDFLSHREDQVVPEKERWLDVTLQKGLRLEGAVVSSSDGRPVPGARLLFHLSRQDQRQVVSDDEGRYGLSGLPAGRIDEVRVSAAGFALRMVEVDLLEGLEVQVRDFTLEKAARLAGRVTDPLGAPVERARVTVFPVKEESPEGGELGWRVRRRQRIQSSRERTDSRGAFEILEANAGPSVRVSIEHSDFKKFTSEIFSLESGMNLDDLTFELESGGGLAVTVVDVNRDVVPDARVRLRRRSEDAGGGRRSGQVTRRTGPEGQALLRGLEEGDYAVVVSKEGFQRFVSRSTIFYEQVSKLAVELLPENVVTGTVTDRHGVPVENARIRARAKATEEGLRDRSNARSDAAGTFRVGNLGQGPYRLEILASDFARQTLEDVEVNTNLSIVLEGLGGISGFVTTEGTGGPVTSFEVHVKRDPAGGEGVPSSRKRKPKTFNDPQGAFSVGELPPGDYVLEVSAADHVGVEVRVTVEDGVVTEGVDVVLVAGLSVRGLVVVGGTDSPVAGAQIFLFPADQALELPEDPESALQRRKARREERESRRAGRRQERGAGEEEDRLVAVVLATMLKAAQSGSSLAKTDDGGSFQLPEMPHGDYVLLVNHDAFVPVYQNVYIGEDDRVEQVHVDLDRGESLEGTITLADGSRASGARVDLRSREGVHKRVLVDPSGHFLASGLLPGEYSFSVRGAVDGQKIRSPRVNLTIDRGLNRFDYRIGD